MVSIICGIRVILYENVNIANLFYDLADLHIHSCSQIRKSHEIGEKKHVFLRIFEKVGWMMTHHDIIMYWKINTDPPLSKICCKIYLGRTRGGF